MLIYLVKQDTGCSLGPANCSIGQTILYLLLLALTLVTFFPTTLGQFIIYKFEFSEYLKKIKTRKIDQHFENQTLYTLCV